MKRVERMIEPTDGTEADGGIRPGVSASGLAVEGVRRPAEGDVPVPSEEMRVNVAETPLSEGELRERALESRCLYEGRVVTLRVDRVLLPSGKEGRREVVEHAPAVAILAETEDKRLLLVRQYRHPVGGEILEIPAGIVEDGEAPAETAARELQEETGYAARRIEPVARFYTSPGFCDEEIWLYYAADLVPSPLPQDEDEFIRLEFLPAESLPELLASSRIRDGKTLLALWWYAATRRP
jgi:ADP-ribose pyrophosphatase